VVPTEETTMAEDPSSVPGVTPPSDDDEDTDRQRSAARDVAGTTDIGEEPETPPPSGGSVEQG
jgi:hypothetical protein